MQNFIFALALLSASPQEDPYEVFRQIWSPYCKGNSLLECPSSQAQELREQIILRMKNGEKGEDLLKEINAQFDNKLRMTPKTEGRESLAYILPWVLFFIGVGFVLLFWKKRKRNAPHTSTSHRVDSNIQNKILRDLDDRDKTA